MKEKEVIKLASRRKKSDLIYSRISECSKICKYTSFTYSFFCFRKKIKAAPLKKKKDADVQEPGSTPTAGEAAGDAAEGSAGDTAGIAAEEKNEDEKFLEEDTGSVASSTKSLAKHLRMLRNALYENYLPPSINNLKINA